MFYSGLVVGVVVAALAASLPAPAGAVTVIGQSPPPAGSIPGCFTGSESYQGTVAFAPDYVVPSAGVIVEWRTQGDPGDSGDLNTFRIYSGDTALAQSQTETLTAGILNRFATRISVTGGERIGLAIDHGGADSVSVCGRSNNGFNGDQINYRQPIAPVGASSPPISPANTQFRLDVSALIEPDADQDGFGDETQDSCVGTGGTQDGCPSPEPPPTPDTSPPTTTITSGPPAKTKRRKAVFGFVSDETATFECALDKNPFFECESPVTFGRVKRKRHTFHVRAIDAAKNVGATVDYRWKVRKQRRRH
jgi:hypothetical protein